MGIDQGAGRRKGKGRESKKRNKRDRNEIKTVEDGSEPINPGKEDGNFPPAGN